MIALVAFEQDPNRHDQIQETDGPQFMNHEGRIQEPFLSDCWVGPWDSDLAFRRVSA